MFKQNSVLCNDLSEKSQSRAYLPDTLQAEKRYLPKVKHPTEKQSSLPWKIKPSCIQQNTNKYNLRNLFVLYNFQSHLNPDVNCV